MQSRKRFGYVGFRSPQLADRRLKTIQYIFNLEGGWNTHVV